MAAIQALMAICAGVIAWTYLAGNEWTFALLWGVLAACVLVLAALTLRGRLEPTGRPTTVQPKGAVVAVGLVLAGAALSLVDATLMVASKGWSIQAIRTLMFGLWAVLFGAGIWYPVWGRHGTAQRGGPRDA